MLKINLGLTWVLSIIFMILKLCRVISWKWIWIFSPVWITILIGLIASAVYIVIQLFRK